jgi:hypothetical protein
MYTLHCHLKFSHFSNIVTTIFIAPNLTSTKALTAAPHAIGQSSDWGIRRTLHRSARQLSRVPMSLPNFLWRQQVNFLHRVNTTVKTSRCGRKFYGLAKRRIAG